MSRSDASRLIAIARLYYRRGLSQQAIADRLGVSRPTVSLALKRCLDRGIVEIRIREPDSAAASLAGDLEERFGLRKAVVVESGADAAERTRLLGRAGAEYLSGILRDGRRIGLSWGTTLHQVVEHLRARPRRGLEVAQLIGALGAGNPACDGFELARNLAARLHGRYSVIQAPAVVRSVKLKRLLLREPAIQEALRRAAAVDVAVVGVSSDRPEHSALVRAGCLTAAEARTLCRRGAVGHTCGWHFDLHGRILRTSSNERLVGIGIADLRRIPLVIGVAGGAEKTDALLGSLRARLLDVLVTDEAAARDLVRRAEPEGRTHAGRSGAGPGEDRRGVATEVRDDGKVSRRT